MTATATVRLDYFYGADDKMSSFYRIPRAFEKDETFRNISLEIKYLYSIMLDRVSISARNGWLDAGRVFIYFSLSEVVRCIHAGRTKAVKVIHDMEELGLIQRRKQGQGKPAMIFVKNIIEDKPEQPAEPEKQEEVQEMTQETAEEVTENQEPKTAENTETLTSDELAHNEPLISVNIAQTHTKNCPSAGNPDENETFGNQKSRLSDSETLDFQNLNPNYTNRNYTDLNYHPSIYPDNVSPDDRRRWTTESPPIGWMDRMAMRDMIRYNIDYDILTGERDSSDMEQIDQYVALMVQACCARKETIRINGEDYPRMIVQSRFRQLNRHHILYVLECMKNTTTQIRNIRAYILSALYNSFDTIDAYYDMCVRHDMANAG